MDLKKINGILKNLDNINLPKVDSKQPGDYWQEKYQGGESRRYDVYDLQDGSGLFLKVEYESDSYGDNEYITSIQFVEPKTKSVTVYE